MTVVWIISVTLGMLSLLLATLLMLLRQDAERWSYTKPFTARDMWPRYSDQMIWCACGIVGCLFMALVAFFENGGVK